MIKGSPFATRRMGPGVVATQVEKVESQDAYAHTLTISLAGGVVAVAMTLLVSCACSQYSAALSGAGASAANAASAVAARPGRTEWNLMLIFLVLCDHSIVAPESAACTISMVIMPPGKMSSLVSSRSVCECHMKLKPPWGLRPPCSGGSGSTWPRYWLPLHRPPKVSDCCSGSATGKTWQCDAGSSNGSRVAAVQPAPGT